MISGPFCSFAEGLFCLGFLMFNFVAHTLKNMGRPQIFDENIVLDKALTVFWKKGYQTTSTRDLINATGISNGSFFNSFGDKKTLYLKCLQKYDAEYMSTLETLLTSNVPFKKKIRTVLTDAVKKSDNKIDYQGCFFFNTSVDNGIDDKDILELSNQINIKTEQAFIASVDLAKRLKEIPANVNSVAMGQYLFNVTTGLRALLLKNHTQATITNIISTTVGMLP